MSWLRRRGGRPAYDDDTLAAAWQVVSLLLDYPDETLLSRLPMLRDVAGCLPAAVRDPLLEAVAALSSAALGDLQREYVDTFDVTRRCCLHLTYAVHGDTRRRGVALVEFKQAYRRAGAEFDSDAELPDHLGVLLEFGAARDVATAWSLLTRYRLGIEVLRAALARRESSYLPVVEALRATLPALEDDDEQALLRLIAEGPPQEEVGLAPYASDPQLFPTIPVGAPR